MVVKHLSLFLPLRNESNKTDPVSCYSSQTSDRLSAGLRGEAPGYCSRVVHRSVDPESRKMSREVQSVRVHLLTLGR